MIPEHLSYDDDLETGIRALKEKTMKTISDPGIRKKVIDSITNLQDISSRVVEPKQLKVGKKNKNQIDQANIILGKRKMRDLKEDLMVKNLVNAEDKWEAAIAMQPEAAYPENKSVEKEASPIARPKKKVKEKHARAKFGLKPGDAISVAPQLFDGKEPGSFSKNNPDRQYGTVKRVWAGRRLAQIEWIDGSKNLVKYEDLKVEKIKVDAALMVTIMMVNAIKAPKDPLDKDGWPRDFFEAMVSPDWRE
jgi:hypothetical protein